MKKVKASFTVEAAVLIPFLLFVMVFAIYLLVYLYDKTLMMQDVNSMATLISDEALMEGQSEKKLLEEEFDLIKKEHPYLSIKNPSLEIKKEGRKTYISVKGDFESPFLGLNREMHYETGVQRHNPLLALYTYKLIKR